MKYLHVDFETFSLVDLKIVGLDNYSKHPSTGVSMLAWAPPQVDEPELWLPHIGPMPKKLLDTINDPDVIIVSWNSQFEWSIFNYVLKMPLPLSKFRDPIVLAHNISLPGKLAKVAEILKMAQQKDVAGTTVKKTKTVGLKDMFCKPVSMGGETTLFGISQPLFRDHNSHPREFAAYGEYCKQDVRTERDLWNRLIKVPFPERDWQGWLLDQKINAFGMPGNRDLAAKALKIAQRYIDEQKTRLKEITKLANPNSDQQMKGWASTRGYPLNSLQVKYVKTELADPQSKVTPECREALTLRMESRKSSYTKIVRFLDLLGSDGRLRWQFRYMGAARTGRWASGSNEDNEASFQPQNMGRGEKAVKKALLRTLELIDNEDYDGIVKLFPSVSPVAVIITILRSLFQAKEGKKIVVSDLNAIECRVLGWMAGCEPLIDIFRHKPEDGGDCYLSFGCKLYNKTYAEMWATYQSGDTDERQNSKPPQLGCGYALGSGERYINENGDEVWGGLMGYARNVCQVEMPKELADKAVKIYRESYPEVVQLWTDLEEAFKQVLRRGGAIAVGQVTWDRETREWVEHPTKGKGCVITFRRMTMEGGGFTIRMELPSGRALHYLNATCDQETMVSRKTGKPYHVDTLHYDGVEHSATQDAAGGTVKKKHKWGRVKTYGGKLCENGDQAISRDVFLNGAFEADDLGFHIFGLFHDELACEESDDMFGLTIHDLVDCQSTVPTWAPGLLLGAEGFEDKIYHK